MEENLADLTEHCKSRAGNSLRGVFTYTEDGGEIIYAREDLRNLYEGEGFEILQNAAWQVHRTILEQTPTIQSIGQYRVTVHTFDDAFVMQFRESTTEGVALVFDRSIGRNLHEFLLECEDYLS